VSTAWLSTLAGCNTIPPAGTPENSLDRSAPAVARIHWPERYKPEGAGFFVHNQIDIDAPPETVWNVLVQAETWPTWYEGAENVRLEGGASGRLTQGASFTWSTMGLDFKSTVVELEAPLRLSWESRKATIQGYHAWLLVPSGRGTTLVTAESQHGFLTVMQEIFVPNKLHRLHDIWLSQIKKRSESAQRVAASDPGGAR
jgi:uncharacterized protein YndB with AHSA1/START domain